MCGHGGVTKSKIRGNEPIFYIQDALKSPIAIACDQGGLGPSARRRFLDNFFRLIYTLRTVGHTLGSKIDRVTGLVIEILFVSVIIDLLLKCSQNFSAIGVN